MSVLRDKADNIRGLSERPNESKEITSYQHIVQIDTRDCVGINSLQCAREAFEANGGRREASGIILSTSGYGISPIKIGTTTLSVSNNYLKNGDTVNISGIQGNTVANNTWRVTNLTIPDGTLPYAGSSFEIIGIGNGNYAGGGQWFRPEDNNYPSLKSTTCNILDNEMIIYLQKRLKAIRSISLNISVIPRDIIPINVYFKDIYDTYLDSDIYTTFIPQEKKYMVDNSYGFYSTPLDIFRSYGGNFAMPNQVTPPPLTLWNPPVGAWPSQPLPYPYQTVPTYRSDTITINGDDYYLICSGYGVYDLNDWTAATRAETEIARKILLGMIIRPQMYDGVDYSELITYCSTTSSDISPYGYGHFQRFLCGPGLQLNYQPGTSDGANPTIAAGDWPIAFPNFRGNVWGPYDSPGDRFQKMGLRDTLQDLFLNGDLSNLNGIPIITPDVETSNLINATNYGVIDLCKLQRINFGNYLNSTNPNILNAMRIISNGFGAASTTAKGFGNAYYTNVYQSSGGIGPSALGAPSAWSLTGIYGAPSLSDPNAVGPLSWNLLSNGTIPQSSVGNLPLGYVLQEASINHRIAWYDSGPTQGTFKSQMKSYFLDTVANVPNTNLVIQVFQFPRNERVQSTNSDVGSSIFNVPIRLLPESLDGGFSYLEGLYALISQSSDLEYWGQRFLSPMASLDKINLRFFTYDGTPIPLEKMLSYNNCLCAGGGMDNLSPLLRSRRFISLLFRIECYQYVPVGLTDIVDKILGGTTDLDLDDNDFAVRAFNYGDYT